MRREPRWRIQVVRSTSRPRLTVGIYRGSARQPVAQAQGYDLADLTTAVAAARLALGPATRRRVRSELCAWLPFGARGPLVTRALRGKTVRS